MSEQTIPELLEEWADLIKALPVEKSSPRVVEMANFLASKGIGTRLASDDFAARTVSLFKALGDANG